MYAIRSYYVTSTTGQIVDSMEMASVKSLNSISDFNKRHFEEKSEVPAGEEQVATQEPQLGTAL